MKKRKKPIVTERIVPIVVPDISSPIAKFGFKENEDEKEDFKLISQKITKTEEEKVPEIKQAAEEIPKVGNIVKKETKKPKFNLFNIPKIQEKQEIKPEVKEETTVEVNHPEKTEEKKEEMKKIMGYNKPLGFGIFRTYEYLAKNSLLYHYDPENADIIEHRDEFGNIADTKAAFKAQSHKFAGSGPGAKRRQKLKEQSIARARLMNQDQGDTPLQSGKALREALEKQGTACIELTGKDKSIIPFIPQEEQADKALEKKKKRLKKIKKRKVISQEEQN